MPAITMKWKAPPPPPQTTASVTKKTLLAIPKALETQKLLLDLDHKARLHPKRFESMWDEYVERLGHVTEENEDAWHLVHGQWDCQWCGKVRFYAKQRDRSSFFLATVDVTVATATTVLTVRASSDATEELVTQLVHLLKATIAQSVGS
ncbi:hypothetical protein GQ600_4736 [Phytophthora cactorum]|nr:hypothetical protein GQ600_4736 [Phytophthora cactorum]